jgi:SAM-dependent methyltransferase
MVDEINANFYRAFEERHRGTRELIKSRLRVYLPFIEPLRGFCGADNAVDLGCGRGEWLELLQEAGFDAQGVDLDDGMLAACRARKLKVQAGDAVTFLKGLSEASQAVVSGFHLAEHIPFADLQVLVAEALRVLMPGGLLILETPNPENIVVGTTKFYLDPTHQRPIPPQLLSFLPEYYGFKRVKTLRLQESVGLLSSKVPTLPDVLYGVSPDCAVVAQKGAAPERMKLFDAAFEKNYGLSLDTLSQLYEARTQQYEEQYEGRIATAEAKLAAVAAVIDAVYNSSSWRITAPLRWCGHQAQLMRQHGMALRLTLDKKIVQYSVRCGDAFLSARPGLRLRCVALIQRFGLYDPLLSFYLRCSGQQGIRNLPRVVGQDAVSNLKVDQLTPRAQRIYADLKAAIERRQKENR